MSLPSLVRIYETRRAPNPRRVSIFLAEKEVEVERVELDIMGGEHLGEEHLKKCGSHHVPALELFRWHGADRNRRHLPLYRGAASGEKPDGC